MSHRVGHNVGHGLPQVLSIPLNKCRESKAVITADASAKGEPALYPVETDSSFFLFFFSVLSGILLHEYSQKSSKVQNTIYL